MEKLSYVKKGVIKSMSNVMAFVPCNFEKYYITNISAMKSRKLFVKFLERIKEEIPVKVFKQSSAIIDSIPSSHQPLFNKNIGICKEDFIKYIRELKLLYWKIILEDTIGEKLYYDNLTWYTLLGNNIFYPLWSDINYENAGFYRAWFFEDCKMYLSLYGCIPYYFVYNNVKLIEDLAVIDMNRNNERELLLLHNKYYGLLSKYIKGNNLEDEITECNFYLSDKNIQIRKLFKYEKGEIILL